MVAALTLVKVTEMLALLPIQILFTLVANTALGPGLIVTVIAGVEIHVLHGEFIERTNTFLVVAVADVLKKVTLNVVVVVVAVNVFQVTPLSAEYSYNAPEI